VLDVAAAAAWLRGLGHPWVCGIGASMGATAVLRAAGLPPHGRFDAVCTVSAPATWGLSDTPAGRAVTRVLVSGPYRLVTGLVGHVRIASSSWLPEPDSAPGLDPGLEARLRRPWRYARQRPRVASPAHGWFGPAPPLDVAATIAPTPVLVVHGVDDHVVDVVHAQLLVDAVGPCARCWLEPAGFGHAEDGLRPAFVSRLADAVVSCASDGRWVPREDGMR